MNAPVMIAAVWRRDEEFECWELVSKAGYVIASLWPSDLVSGLWSINVGPEDGFHGLNDIETAVRKLGECLGVKLEVPGQ